jgi:hypothetical protein
LGWINGRKIIFKKDRVGSLQEKIKRDSKYEINDQVLLTKKGLKLRPDEKLDLFLNDPLLQSTMVNQDAAGRNKPLYVARNLKIRKFPQFYQYRSSMYSIFVFLTSPS